MYFLRVRVLFYAVWFLLARLFSPLLLTHFAVSMLNVLYFHIRGMFFLAFIVIKRPLIVFRIGLVLVETKNEKITFNGL